MNRQSVWIAALLVAAMLPTSGWAGKTQQFPVQVVFRDAAGDAIQSDGQGAYVDGVDGVQALIIDDRGRLSFHTCVDSGRKKAGCPGPRAVLLDFSRLAGDVLGSAAEPGPTSVALPFITGLADSLHSAVNLVDINGEWLPDGLLGMTEVGEQLLAGMKVNFTDANGLLFTIRLSENAQPDSNWVLVTYNGGQIPCDDTIPCASWTVEAWTGVFTDPMDMCCPTNELYDIGTLVSDNTNDEGDYHLPFLITITALPQSGDSGGPGGGHGKSGNGN